MSLDTLLPPSVPVAAHLERIPPPPPPAQPRSSFSRESASSMAWVMPRVSLAP